MTIHKNVFLVVISVFFAIGAASCSKDETNDDRELTSDSDADTDSDSDADTDSDTDSDTDTDTDTDTDSDTDSDTDTDSDSDTSVDSNADTNTDSDSASDTEDTVICGNGATPVERWGQLQVNGAQLQDACGNNIQLKGPSSMWLHWEEDGFAESKEALLFMRDNWGATVIRAAMGVEPDGAYLSDPNKARSQVAKIVQNAIDVGMYVIIDWHDHDALEHQSQAEAFFADMANTYGEYPNVIYETFNEPLKVDWSTELKPYHTAVLSSIRAVDPDNVVVLGTPNWSQYVNEPVSDRVDGSNLMYTLHFYACTHDYELRDIADEAYNAGLPMFVTEWGATPADGGEPPGAIVCEDEATLWHNWLDERNISWAAWKLDACEDSSCILSSSASQNGPWNDLHGHGDFVVSRMQN